MLYAVCLIMRFIADSMLGRLGKWLRILGFDTLYVKNAPDEKILKTAVREKRVLLTRDHVLAEATPLRLRCFIENNKYTFHEITFNYNYG